MDKRVVRWFWNCIYLLECWIYDLNYNYLKFISRIYDKYLFSNTILRKTILSLRTPMRHIICHVSTSEYILLNKSSISFPYVHSSFNCTRSLPEAFRPYRRTYIERNTQLTSLPGQVKPSQSSQIRHPTWWITLLNFYSWQRVFPFTHTPHSTSYNDIKLNLIIKWNN